MELHLLFERYFNQKFIPEEDNSKNKNNNAYDDEFWKNFKKHRAKDEGEFSYLLWRIENDRHFEYHNSTFDLGKKNAINALIELLEKTNLSQIEKYNILITVLNKSCEQEVWNLISNFENYASSFLLKGINLLLETKSADNYKYIILLLSYANEHPKKSLTRKETLDYCKCIADYPGDFQKQFIIDLLNNYPKLRNYVSDFDSYSIGQSEDYPTYFSTYEEKTKPLTLSYFCENLDKEFLATTDPLLIQYVANILYRYINTKKCEINWNTDTSYLANIKNLINNPNYEVIYLILNNDFFNVNDITTIFSKSYIYDEKPLEMSTEFNELGMLDIRLEILKILLTLKEKDDIDFYLSLVEDFFGALISNLSGEKEELEKNSDFLEAMKKSTSMRLQLKKKG